MQFNTFLYILLFLPVTVIGWFVIGHFNKLAAKLFLIGMSLWFYAYAGLDGFKWLLINMAVNYAVVLLMRRKRLKSLLWAGIIFNAALLVYFKYTNFAITTINDLTHQNIALLNSLVLPIGISFFTFQQISYLVDSYRGETEENTLLDYVLYVVYFPKLLMGPIVKQKDLLPQFKNEIRPSSENVVKGLQMFVIGLFKKVIFADTFSKAVTWTFGLPDLNSATSMDMILVMFAYTFQIYFDFSGYSDMATGSAIMMNITLPMNFDSPYKAYSIRDFWKRWHISLTKFLTEYIYIPLGGSRKGKFRTYLNTMIVFLVSGFWHGANRTFVLWGILHGLFSIFDRLTDRIRKNIHPALQWMLTFLVVSILWLLFRCNTITQWKLALLHIFAFHNMAISPDLINSFTNPEQAVITKIFHLQPLTDRITGFWMLGFYVLAIVMCLGFENAYRKKYSNNIVIAMLTALLFIFTLTCIGSTSVFIYNNF